MYIRKNKDQRQLLLVSGILEAPIVSLDDTSARSGWDPSAFSVSTGEVMVVNSQELDVNARDQVTMEPCALRSAKLHGCHTASPAFDRPQQPTLRLLYRITAEHATGLTICFRIR